MSSRLLMFATTSVWIGCATNSRVATKGSTRFCLSRKSASVPNSRKAVDT